MEQGLLARYAVICGGDNRHEPAIIRAQISQILCETANRGLPVLAKAVAGEKRDKIVNALMLCGDCFEAAIAFERTQVGACIGLAQAYAIIGNIVKSHEWAKMGLALLAEVRDYQGSKVIARGESSIFPPNIFDQMGRQLRTYLKH
jgi:hypothetical protein